jgi:hypothetical protein
MVATHVCNINLLGSTYVATAMPATSRRAVDFCVEDAQDAVARADYGTPEPGDAALIAAYERHCQDGWAAYYDAELRAQIAEAAADHADDCDSAEDCDHWTHEEH